MRARSLFIGLMMLMGVGFAPSPAGAVDLPDLGAVLGPLVQENPPAAVPVPVPDVDIEVNKTTERVVWYTDPLVIGAAVVVLIVVIALVARGGGTTIVRD